LPQLQGERALEFFWFSAGKAIKSDQQFLLQHAFSAVVATGAFNQGGDRWA
jgi:hypothetical protein